MLILNLPFIGSEICRRPARHSPSANFSFADGKQKICNRQVRRWPTANFSFVIGKFFIFKREIFCHRQILSFFFTKHGLETEQASCSVSSYQVLERSDKPVWSGQFTASGKPAARPRRKIHTGTKKAALQAACKEGNGYYSHLNVCACVFWINS